MLFLLLVNFFKLFDKFDSTKSVMHSGDGCAVLRHSSKNDPHKGGYLFSLVLIAKQPAAGVCISGRRG